MKITFNGSPNPTLGVEFELQILDPETKNLVSGAPRILERPNGDTHVKPELIESTIELNTDICAPFANWSEQHVTPKERYLRLVDRCQRPARRLMIFGRSDTGLASCRVKVFESLQTAGLPYRLLNWAEFQRLMTTLVNAKAIETIREVWWDVRPHPAFGTVEVRICDGLSTFDEVIAMTAMIQTLVVWLGDRYDDGGHLPLQRYWIVRENKWRAALWALDAEIIIDEAGHLQRLSESIRELLTSLTPVAERLGCATALAGVDTNLEKNPSYERQRRLYEETGDFTSVMTSLIREFRDSVSRK